MRVQRADRRVDAVELDLGDEARRDAHPTCELAETDAEALALGAETVADLRALETALDGLGDGAGSLIGRPRRCAHAVPDTGANLLCDPPGTGQERVLERRAVRDRRVGRGDAPGVVEIAEAVLDDASASTSPAQPPVSGPSSTTTIRFVLRDRGEDGLEVERPERAQVDHLDRSRRRPASSAAASRQSWTPFIAVTIVRSPSLARRPPPRRAATGVAVRPRP